VFQLVDWVGGRAGNPVWGGVGGLLKKGREWKNNNKHPVTGVIIVGCDGRFFPPICDWANVSRRYVHAMLFSQEVGIK